MYVEEISIQSVKLLRDVRLSFLAHDGSLRMWTMLVGDNGLCKTTLLQSIALAAAGTTRANQLANVPSFPDRRQGSPTAEIRGTFRVGTRLDGPQGVRQTDATRPAARRVESQLAVAPPAQVFHGGSSSLSRVSTSPRIRWAKNRLVRELAGSSSATESDGSFRSQGELNLKSN